MEAYENLQLRKFCMLFATPASDVLLVVLVMLLWRWSTFSPSVELRGSSHTLFILLNGKPSVYFAWRSLLREF